MDHQQQKPLIIAHRGASMYAPENTLSAFKLAYEQGADGIELDAKLTIDGEVVVIHDQTLDRTTGSPGRVIDKTLKQLQMLDAGSHFADQFRGEKIPTLNEVFDQLGKKMLINVELTSYASPGDALPEKVAQLVQKHGIENDILFSTFHPTILLRIKRLLPTVPAALLTGNGFIGFLGRSFIGRLLAPDLIHPFYTYATRNFIHHQHDIHRKVNVWTVNSSQDIQRCITDQVDGIITDDPPTALRVRGGK